MLTLRFRYQARQYPDNDWKFMPASFKTLALAKLHCQENFLSYRIWDNDKVIVTVDPFVHVDVNPKYRR